METIIYRPECSCVHHRFHFQLITSEIYPKRPSYRHPHLGLVRDHHYARRAARRVLTLDVKRIIFGWHGEGLCRITKPSSSVYLPTIVIAEDQLRCLCDLDVKSAGAAAWNDDVNDIFWFSYHSWNWREKAHFCIWKKKKHTFVEKKTTELLQNVLFFSKNHLQNRWISCLTLIICDFIIQNLCVTQQYCPVFLKKNISKETKKHLTKSTFLCLDFNPHVTVVKCGPILIPPPSHDPNSPSAYM